MYLTKHKEDCLKGNIAWLEQKINKTSEDYHQEILDPVIVLNYLKGLIDE